VTKSDVAMRGVSILARFEFGKPCVGSFGCSIQTGVPIVRPRGKGILVDAFMLLLALKALFFCIAHDPERPAVVGRG
jgi:hypothetical protein